MVERTAPVRIVGWVALALLLGLTAYPAAGQETTMPPPPPSGEPDLPSGTTVLDVNMQEQQVFRIAIPDLLGAPLHSQMGGEILRNDFTLMPGYTVLGPNSIRHDYAAEGLGFRPAAWANLDVRAVIKGRVTAQGQTATVEMRLYLPARGATSVLTKNYSGQVLELRHWMHDFANEVLRVITGIPGPFGTQITYARRLGPGRKDVFLADMDGYGEARISSGEGINLLPSFGPRSVWFSRLTPLGMFITHSRANNRPVIQSSGLNMRPTFCNNRILFSSTRDGNSEIYSSNVDGGDVRRLTDDPGIDVSPDCGPHGEVAWVSNRHGSPQIFVMNGDGSNLRRVTFRGSHNQTPSWCPDANRQLLAFTGRDTTLDIFTLDLATNQYTRLTQGQGLNKDPAFSPDCRIVAFVSDRRGAPGVYLSSLLGFNQRRVIAGDAETVRWSR